MGTGREIAIVEPNGSTAVAPTHAVQMGVLHADSPAAVIEAASAIATPLAELIHSRRLSTRISGRDYVVCEGWTTLAVMLGVTPHEVSVVEEDGVYTATVELRTLADGKAIARASAECGAPDEVWGKRARYARRSMALTRATGKACRMAFSWIMILAGYQATPAEEMEDVEYSPVERPKPERASAGDIDIIQQLLKAPIAADVVKQVNKRIAKGMTPEQAGKCIAHLRGLIAQLDSDEDTPADQDEQPTKHPALVQAAAVYHKALEKHRTDLLYDTHALEAFEVGVNKRPSAEDWTVREFSAASAAVVASKENPEPNEAA